MKQVSLNVPWLTVFLMNSRMVLMQLPSLLSMAASNRALFSNWDLYHSREYDYDVNMVTLNLCVSL